MFIIGDPLKIRTATSTRNTNATITQHM